jgi:hypothetical protein
MRTHEHGVQYDYVHTRRHVFIYVYRKSVGNRYIRYVVLVIF